MNLTHKEHINKKKRKIFIASFLLFFSILVMTRFYSIAFPYEDAELIVQAALIMVKLSIWAIFVTVCTATLVSIKREWDEIKHLKKPSTK